MYASEFRIMKALQKTKRAIGFTHPIQFSVAHKDGNPTMRVITLYLTNGDAGKFIGVRGVNIDNLKEDLKRTFPDGVEISVKTVAGYVY